MKLKDLKKKLQNENYDIPDVYNKIKPFAKAPSVTVTPLKKPKKSLVVRMSFVLSSLILVLFVSVLFYSQKNPTSEMGLTYGVSMLNSEDNVKSIMNSNIYPRYNNSFAFSCKKQATNTDFYEKQDYGVNIQVAGVEEDDVVKTDEHHIYNLYTNEVVIYECANEDINYVNTLILNKEMNYTTGKLQLTDEYLITIYELLSDESEVRIYDLADEFNLIKTYTVDGGIVDTRLTNDKLFLITSKDIIQDNIDEPSFIIDEKKSSIAYKDIWYVNNALNISYIITSTIDLDTLEITQTANVGGNVSFVYASLNNLYITCERYVKGKIITTIYVYSIIDDTEFFGVIQLDGSIINEYSIDEYNNMVRLFVNGYQYSYNTTVNTKNHLFIFDLTEKDEKTKKFSLIGSLTKGIGEYNQDIKSSYFDNEYGYVVTYEKTDPLYKISLKDPTSPKIEAKIKAPGYSEYLHKFNDLMVGIGYDDSNNPKIALYDTLDTHEQIGLNVPLEFYLEENVRYNFTKNKELFVLNDLNIIGIPVVSYNYDGYKTEVLLLKVNSEKLKKYEEFIAKQNIEVGNIYLNYSVKNDTFELYMKTSGAWEFIQSVDKKQIDEYKARYETTLYDLTDPVIELALEVKNDTLKDVESSIYQAPSINREYIQNQDFYLSCYKYELRRVVYINNHYVGITSVGLVIYNDNFEYVKTIYKGK